MKASFRLDFLHNPFRARACVRKGGYVKMPVERGLMNIFFNYMLKTMHSLLVPNLLMNDNNHCVWPRGLGSGDKDGFFHTR